VTEREPLAFTPEEEAEERAFIRKYGALAPFDPPRLAEFMAGFPRPWWIVGGWSIEAFTGAPREHEDVDLRPSTDREATTNDRWRSIEIDREVPGQVGSVICHEDGTTGLP